MFSVEPGTVMRGNLVAAGTIRLDGWLEGDVTCSRLVIGPDGYLLGRALVKELWVEGQIVGAVTANTVQLEDGAFVEGDVMHTRLVVKPGAILSGRSQRIAGVRMPEDYVVLETRALHENAHLDRAERESLRAVADQAVVEYPGYQRARDRLAALRGQ
jgi:hypothetical protein